ncbi:segregation/condensation protein A [Streptococcus zalophi]|uniref:Segregation and condensation protein A n=1 Tax=Streptococcus zalophi TaxID=640031 RepID=A0A934PA41_9STRE|nr:segregation/condensation protein A [Streptococcus zalophi]MBJ8349744.1 segregation/condensation protein A [Streptococcus zalophi]MCR8967910.1 segregation/condensation protein A [Streptococcus zalophi]
MDIKLKDFEGPLDLLLHLVSKYQMDIYDVPIVDVIEQYLTYIKTLQEMKLEIAGDYMVMASQLMVIKSRRLLPKVVEETPIDEDPEQLLLQQIEEYRQFKELSQKMAEQHQKRALYFSKPKQELIYEDMTLNHDKSVLDIYLAFSTIMAEKQKQIKNTHTTIERDDFRIEDMMIFIEEKMTTFQKITLRELFEESHNINEMITIFLATLELIKVQSIVVTQKENFGDILLVRGNA